MLLPEGRHFRAPNVASDSGTAASPTDVGLQQLRFKAMSEGEVLLDLALVRPGTGLGAAADRWIVQVVVR